MNNNSEIKDEVIVFVFGVPGLGVLCLVPWYKLSEREGLII